MAVTFARSGTSNSYDASVRNITSRQTALANLQENLTSGKKVVRASDDPTSAANAERALTRISRIVTDQRALESQRNAIAVAESTLGDITTAMQRIRELAVSAGDGVHTTAERVSIATEMQGLRDNIFTLANSKDTNGLPLFSSLGSALAPFVGPQATAPDYTFQGLPGQTTSSDVTIPFTLDGESAFMHQPGRDANFNVSLSTIPTGRNLSTDTVSVTDNAIVIANATAASAATPSTPYPVYAINFTAVDTTTKLGTTTATYTLTESPAVSNPAVAATPITVSYPSNGSMNVTGIPGLSFNITGTPAVGDTATVSNNPSLFSVLDTAIRDVTNAPNNNGAAQAVGQALHNIDISMSRVSAIRGQAGDLLNRADRISTNQDKRSTQLESDRSRAEDIDMVKGISDFQAKQSGYSAALQTYAQVQKLSLFTYIN